MAWSPPSPPPPSSFGGHQSHRRRGHQPPSVAATAAATASMPPTPEERRSAQCDGDRLCAAEAPGKIGDRGDGRKPERAGKNPKPARADSKFEAALPLALDSTWPAVLDSTSHPPSIFDGTIRLYLFYDCPFAQRAWIARNYKGLQDIIKLVPLDEQDRPSWYKEKVYPLNKVPALEHNNEVRGESLDLVKYIDSHFDGPSLLPEDSAKRQFAEELLSYNYTFLKSVAVLMTGKLDIETEFGPTLDYLESSLSKFNDGPFFVGQFSMVDIVYVPFIERLHDFFLDMKEYDFMAGRPNLATWLKEMNMIEAYTSTCCDPKMLIEQMKIRFSIQ